MTLLLKALILAALVALGSSRRYVEVFQTALNTRDRLTEKTPLTLTKSAYNASVQITVAIDHTQKYQQILGFGGAFTEAAAYVWSLLNADLQEQVIEMYFGATGNGYSVGRTHINSCDFSLDSWSFDDTVDDFSLKNFNTSHNERWMFPFLTTALKNSVRPIRLFLTPWSPPAWMKGNGQMDGSSHPGLKKDPRYHDAWALFFAKSVADYKSRGIPVWGLTIQNEPEFAAPWEACCYTPEEQLAFLTQHLGPLMRKEHPEVKIMIFDHNRDSLPIWVKTIMTDPVGRQYADGSAFHWYVCDDCFANVSQSHDIAPDKFLLATEACTCPPKLGAWDKGEKYAQDIIGDLNAWAVGWTDWNLLLDTQGGPNHLQNWCDAPIIADVKNQQLLVQSPYWYMGHISRFVIPQSVRIGWSSTAGDAYKLQVLAVETPEGNTVVVILNTNDVSVNYKLEDQGEAAFSHIPARAIQTLVYITEDPS